MLQVAKLITRLSDRKRSNCQSFIFVLLYSSLSSNWLKQLLYVVLHKSTLVYTKYDPRQTESLYHTKPWWAETRNPRHVPTCRNHFQVYCNMALAQLWACEQWFHKATPIIVCLQIHSLDLSCAQYVDNPWIIPINWSTLCTVRSVGCLNLWFASNICM